MIKPAHAICQAFCSQTPGFSHTEKHDHYAVATRSDGFALSFYYDRYREHVAASCHLPYDFNAIPYLPKAPSVKTKILNNPEKAAKSVASRLVKNALEHWVECQTKKAQLDKIDNERQTRFEDVFEGVVGSEFTFAGYTVSVRGKGISGHIGECLGQNFTDLKLDRLTDSQAKRILAIACE